MRYYNYEIYVKHPTEDIDGWDIEFVSVLANSRKDAREKLNGYPRFDCVISFNYSHEIKEILTFSS